MLNIIIFILSAIIILLILFFLFWRFCFLRNPERVIPKGSNIVSPADGKVIGIWKINKNGIINMGNKNNKNEKSIKKIINKKNNQITIKKHFGIIKTLIPDVGKECYLISIFMSPLDVHYNRAPLDGKVLSVKYSKGKFFNAKSLALENEKNEILIKTKIGNIKVIQIAGLIARRIECFVRKNQVIKKGQRIGLINLGSQVITIMPKRKVKIVVSRKERVKGGKSIIAKIR